MSDMGHLGLASLHDEVALREGRIHQLIHEHHGSFRLGLTPRRMQRGTLEPLLTESSAANEYAGDLAVGAAWHP